MKNQTKIKEVISLLKEIDIDGETMEDILELVGLREQVVHQILGSERYIAAQKVWEDFNNNETLSYDSDDFDRYYNDKHLL